MKPASLYNVGSETQLLIDTAFFDVSQRVALRLHPAQKTGEKTLVHDRDWESAALNWFSVMEDAGRYRMWYECYGVDDWTRPDDTSFCYAESDDALHWTKPALDFCAYQDHRKTNILFRQIGEGHFRSRVHGTGVFRDPTAGPDSRYKAVSQGITSLADPPHRIAGMYSADGLRWTRIPAPICDLFADSQYSGFWDPARNAYVLYGRVPGHGRSLGWTESPDFTRFPALQLVLETDDQDPANSDLYNPAAWKYPWAAHVYLMFPSLYRHEEDTLDIRLAVSRDGIRWTWPERMPFIPLGEKGDFDSGALYMGQGVIRKGNELWHYYSGSRLKHNEGELPRLLEPGNDRVFTRAVTPLDRYVSADAGPDGGSFTTPPLTFTGDTLALNVETRSGGSVRAGLLDEGGIPIPGRAIADCVPITGNHRDIRVRWQDNGDVSARDGRPTRLRVEMVNTSLYAFRFAGGDAAAGRPEAGARRHGGEC